MREKKLTYIKLFETSQLIHLKQYFKIVILIR